MKRIIFLLTFILLTAVQIPAARAFQMFLDIPNIPGESRDKGHSDWIEVSAFHHSITNNGTGPVHGDFVIVKHLDKSSPLLSLKVNQGTRIPQVTLDVQKEVVGAPSEDYYTVVLQDVIISSVQSSGTESSTEITETISFQYE